MTDPFNGERWNPSGRYLVDVMFGDGGEMYASAWPECIANPDSEIKRTAHGWADWVTVAECEGTTPALLEGIKQAEAHFEKVYAK